jgi:hypothetical protein
MHAEGERGARIIVTGMKDVPVFTKADNAKNEFENFHEKS